VPFNVTGQPVLSLPCGTTESGLPVGLQIAGPLGADALVLSLGAALERALA
jgi:aspartyl-tRNA(Asn)/glutamyl-tRNA(Gln) amidotransferase subunit A